MTTTNRITPPVAATTAATRTTTTRRLLACGAVAGPLYIAASAIQLATRDGFDLARHPLSLLSLGDLGWIQIANFVLSGLLFLAGAVGMHRAMVEGKGRVWAPRLVGFFGLSLVWAGVFVADPADGFPSRTAADDPTWHGIAHSIAPALGFLALIVACFVFARWFARQGRRGWAAYSAIVGVALFTPDLLMGRDGFTIALAAAAAVGWTWASSVAVHLLSTTPNNPA